MAATIVVLAGCTSPESVDPEGGTGGAQASVGLPVAGFDDLYPADFALTELSADPIPELSAPSHAATAKEGYRDPVYGTVVYRATDVGDGGGNHLRHEYSRRQAFNADNTRFLAQDETGYWHLYDANTFEHLGVLEGLAGDCEPMWSASDPVTLIFTEREGGPVWWRRDIATGATTVAFDLTGRTPWPEATSYTTKAEGSPSADGRYLALMALSYEPAIDGNVIHGLVTVDVQEDEIVGTLDAAAFDGIRPDYVAISASGDWVVASWGKGEGGTRAFSRDFSESRMLFDGIEHSDLAFGPENEDMIVYADYDLGAIRAIDIGTGAAFDIAELYPSSGESYAVHISGQAFDRPGWVVISTYEDGSDYGQRIPSEMLRPEYRKVWLAELVPDGQRLNVAHTHQLHPDGTPYWAEPQATASRDLSRILFASSFGGDTIESYLVGLPSWALDR